MEHTVFIVLGYDKLAVEDVPTSSHVVICDFCARLACDTRICSRTLPIPAKEKEGMWNVDMFGR